jgi:hypothetical protein
MVVSGGQLRPATETEAAHRRKRVAAEGLTRVPGLGKEGLQRLLETDGAAKGGGRRLLITCTCGHLFLDEQPRT